MRLTLAQINPTIGDISGNIALMDRAAEQAEREGADLVVFPELSLTAYYPADLLDDPSFQARIEQGLQELLTRSRARPNLYWVVGAPTANARVGKKKPQQPAGAKGRRGGSDLPQAAAAHLQHL